MGMRIDQAGHHDLSGRVYGLRGLIRARLPHRAKRGDLSASDRDKTWLEFMKSGVKREDVTVANQKVDFPGRSDWRGCFAAMQTSHADAAQDKNAGGNPKSQAHGCQSYTWVIHAELCSNGTAPKAEGGKNV